MEYLLKYSELSIRLLTGSIILLILLAHKSITYFLQILFSRLHLELSLYRAKITKHFLWTKEEIANSTSTVTSLFVYHVKSISPVSCHKATIDSCGLAGDRRYMLVVPRKVPICGYHKPDDATHRFLTQCHYPILCKVVSDVVKSTTESIGSSDTTYLRFSMTEGNSSVEIAIKPKANAPIYRTTLWDDKVLVQDMGDKAALFFQSILANDTETSETIHTTNSVRLVVQCDKEDRIANDRFLPFALRSILGCNPRMHLGSAYPVLIASEASLEDLNRRLNGKGIESIPMSRFRPNIVIQGITPFAEDGMKVIQIGTTIFHIVACCPRCKQTCIDGTTGSSTAEPLRTMMEFREMNSNSVYFAVHAIPAWNSIGNEIRVGDTVKVLQWGEPIWGDL